MYLDEGKQWRHVDSCIFFFGTKVIVEKIISDHIIYFYFSSSRKLSGWPEVKTDVTLRMEQKMGYRTG